MGCPYCGSAVIQSGKGRPRKFCSDRCAKNYAELLRQRRIKGLNVPLAWCKNCGRILKNRQREYCCPECKARHGVTYNGYNALRLAILRQAAREGRLKRWAHTESFQKLFPEIDPEYITRLAKEKRI